MHEIFAQILDWKIIIKKKKSGVLLLLRLDCHGHCYTKDQNLAIFPLDKVEEYFQRHSTSKSNFVYIVFVMGILPSFVRFIDVFIVVSFLYYFPYSIGSRVDCCVVGDFTGYKSKLVPVT